MIEYRAKLKGTTLHTHIFIMTQYYVLMALRTLSPV